MYSILFSLSYILAWLLYPFNTKIRLWLKGNIGNIKSIKELRKNDDAPLVWIHCASLGEFEQGKPLLEAFMQENPNYKSLVTFFSSSGYIPSKKYNADYIAYLPLDTWFNAKRFIDAVRPKIVFWVKYDFWKNHLKVLYKKNIPCYLVSAVFRTEQIYFKTAGRIFGFSKVLHYFKHLFVQTKQSKQLLESINIANVTVSGDTRFDRVREIAQTEFQNSIIEKFVENSDKILIIGSSWPKDEVVIADAAKNIENLKLIVVPHEIDSERIDDCEKTFSMFKTIRYSQANTENVSTYNTLIVDTIGMLSRIYRFANAAYIGCGFDHGIHNVLEAAVYGKPVVFGPKYTKFEEAKDLIALGGAYSISNAKELDLIFDLWLNNDDLRRQGEICAAYVQENSGSTNKILTKIREDFEF